MSEENTQTEHERKALEREKRRSEQLRANLMRRKAQIRSRRAGEEDSRTDGIVAAQDSAADKEI